MDGPEIFEPEWAESDNHLLGCLANRRTVIGG
jgi:hypothetical protein